jgi:hypothetical protein
LQGHAEERAKALLKSRERSTQHEGTRLQNHCKLVDVCRDFAQLGDLDLQWPDVMEKLRPLARASIDIPPATQEAFIRCLLQHLLKGFMSTTPSADKVRAIIEVCKPWGSSQAGDAHKEFDPPCSARVRARCQSGRHR